MLYRITDNDRVNAQNICVVVDHIMCVLVPLITALASRLRFTGGRLTEVIPAQD